MKGDVKSWRGDSRGIFTFCRVVHEEALKELVLDGSLLCRVIGQDVFVAHIIQTWKKKEPMSHLIPSQKWWPTGNIIWHDKSERLYSDWFWLGCVPGMAYRALLSSWLARNVTASVWDLWDCHTQHKTTVTQRARLKNESSLEICSWKNDWHSNNHRDTSDQLGTSINLIINLCLAPFYIKYVKDFWFYTGINMFYAKVNDSLVTGTKICCKYTQSWQIIN